MTIKRNMAGWHRALYALSGVALLVWGWGRDDGRILPLAFGIILIGEALTGFCPGCALLGQSTRRKAE